MLLILGLKQPYSGTGFIVIGRDRHSDSAVASFPGMRYVHATRDVRAIVPCIN